MSSSRELLKRLKTDEEPLAKRLKLAENAFRTVDLPVVRKEDLILEWLCKLCTRNHDLWHTLERCLQSGHFDIKTNIKKLLVDVFIQKFNKDPENVHEEVFRCYKLLVENSTMQKYFIAKPKELSLLIQSVLNFVSEYLECTFEIEYLSKGTDAGSIKHNNVLLIAAYDTVISTVENITQMYKLAVATKDEFRIMFIKDILYLLCTVIDHKCTDSTNRLGAVAHKCVQQLLFRKNKMYEKDKCNKHVHADLLLMFKENTNMTSVQRNITALVFVFRAAIGIYKSDTNTLDLILRELVESFESYKNEIFSACLKQLDDVIFDFENKIHNVTFFEYCQRLVDDILSKENITDVDYDLLTQLTYFNPLIIEKKILDILKKIFLQEQTIKYTCLITAILDASIRLRREEKLISQILMSLKHSSDCKVNRKTRAFFPLEFRTKFIKSVNNITNLQAVAMLRTLIFHLSTDCAEVLQSNTTCKCTVIMNATIELLVFLFEGTCVFGYKGTIASQQKFVNALNDLGNVLSQLCNRALHLNHNKKIIIMLLTAVLSWSKVQNTLKYYIPKAITHELTFPIVEDQWLQLIQRITNFGEDSCKNIMNELILHQFRISQSISNKPTIKLNILIGGLEHVWNSVLKFDPEIVLFMSDEEISNVVHLLLRDMTSNEENFEQWSKVLQKECLQENKPFMISLLCHILNDIGKIANTGITKSVTNHIQTKPLVEAEVSGSKQILKILDAVRKELSLNEWVYLESTHCQHIILHLRVLKYVPLAFLCVDIRILTFLVIYSVFKESDQNNEIKILCSRIFADLLEKSGLNIFQYMDPILLLDHLAQDRELPKVFEQALRYVGTYPHLKKYVKLSLHDEGIMCTLLGCMKNIKPKLNADQKPAFKKVENALSKKILSTVTIHTTKPETLKSLPLALKIAISKGKVSEDLKNIAESTLLDVFTIDSELVKYGKSTLLEETLQLAIVMLRNHKIFNIKDDTIKSIWHVMLKHPCKDLLLPLLESTRQKEFQELLNLLLLSLDENMPRLDGGNCEQIFLIWDAVIKADMSTKRNKLRLAAIDKLCQNMLIVDIPNCNWPNLLKLLQNIIAAKHLYIPGNVIDINIILSIKSLEKANILICNNVLILCGILVKSRTSLITDRLHALLLLYRHVLNFIICVSKTTSDKFEEHQFRCLALDVERFTSLLIKLKKDMTRLSPYLVADILQLFMDIPSTSSVKISIQNCIGQLISICDQHGIALLSRTLPTSTQEVFKIHLDTFNKFHKFSGKI